MDKKTLSERDICTKFITPAVRQAGWDEITQIREEVSFTKGRIIVRGKLVTRGKAKRADYVLYYKPNIPIALIEAKDNNCSVGDGMQQALEYADTLDIPFVFSSNGDGFVFHDRTGTERQRSKPTSASTSSRRPATLWAKYRAWKGLAAEAGAVVLQDYFDDGSGKEPRYYQAIAINAAIEAIAKGQDRVLLVMATGTGKTYTAFQIIWRLWKAGRKKRILFLADRNVLDRPDDGQRLPAVRPGDGEAQHQREDDRARGRHRGRAADRDRQEAAHRHRLRDLPRPLPGDHRPGGAPEALPRVLARLLRPDRRSTSATAAARPRTPPGGRSSTTSRRATQIGMTATPKETKYVSNIHYFGEPVYTYSLKQGIQDGFLAPYKVVKVHIDGDVEGYRPETGRDRP